MLPAWSPASRWTATARLCACTVLPSITGSCSCTGTAELGPGALSSQAIQPTSKLPSASDIKGASGRRIGMKWRLLFLAVNTSSLHNTWVSLSFLEHSKHNEAQFLVSHSRLCLFYLKLSLQSFVARDQTNKREFGSCNVWSQFCSEVKLKIAPKQIDRHSFWRPFGST